MKNGDKISLNYYECFLAIIIMMVSELSSNKLFLLPLAIYSMICTLFWPKIKILFFMILLLPIAENLSFLGTLTIPSALSYVYVVRFLIEIIISKKIKIEKWYVCHLFLLLLGILNYYLTKSTYQLMISLKAFSFFVLINDVIYNSAIKQKIKYSNIYIKSIRYLGFGLIIATILSIFINKGIYLSRFSFVGKSTTNIIGIQSSIVIIALLFNFIISSKIEKKDIILILFCLFIVLITMSRTAIIITLLGILLLELLSILKKRKLRILLFYIIMIICTLLLYTFNNNFRKLSNMMIDRFKVEDISNGRYTIWSQTINIMNNNKKYKFFGAGNYTNIGVLNSKKQESIMAHNFILETWVIYGYIGTIILIIEISLLIKSCLQTTYKQLKSYNIISFVPAITLIGALMYSHHFIGKASSLLFVISFLPIVMQKELTLRNNENE